MLTVILVALATLLVGTLAGWFAHVLLHARACGMFYRYHLAHHRVYTFNDFRSKRYIGPKYDPASLFIVALVSISLITMMSVFLMASVAWLSYAVVVFIGVTVGYVHEYVHRSFHIQDHWLDRFEWFNGMKEKHRIHHGNARVNFSIMWYVWDRVFGTFNQYRR